ncbi:MAG: hypothetical protein COA50_04655 [Flavobacteriaceae bacterium]|nr:MAG: hypothetical protein COA50_04655 [Flavobacteriaceae bacterium]
MDSYDDILKKLSLFVKKYYTKVLLRGIILFVSFGLLYFLVTLGVEYFLWLNSIGRLILFFLFVVVELCLLYKYILVPLFYLFKLKRGISNKYASILIGRHFPEVDDKLYNLLDLADDLDGSELLLASIVQRSDNLTLFQFNKAIDFSENIKYAKYFIIPVAILCLIWVSGNLSSFFGSYNRVVNYDLAYEPPAPFVFHLVSNDLDVLESESFTIEVATIGKFKPEEVFIVINGKEFLLQEDRGSYLYSFPPPLRTTDFYFLANDIQSRTYTLNALFVPSIQEFNMLLDYPNYTEKPTETIKGSGNAILPEGTKVTWQIKGKNTESIHLIEEDTAAIFSRKNEMFHFEKKIYAKLLYDLTTSNTNVKDYERLGYTINVIKDDYPSIEVIKVVDSLNPNVLYFVGEVSDDYKVSTIQLVCYNASSTRERQIIELGRPNSNFDEFYYTFPSGLSLDIGKKYSLYFQTTDNDAIHHGKTSRSNVFNMALSDSNQLKNKILEKRESIIDNLEDTLDKYKEQKEILKDINKNQIETKELNFNSQTQIMDFLNKQQLQESMMQKFSKQLKENLDENVKEDEINQFLKERLERQELEARKNEKLLEELQKVADKINKEELAKKLEEIAKNQQNNERSLEQLLELTKRYYVTEKASQLAKDLEQLSKKQNTLSKIRMEDFSPKQQEMLNDEFDEISEELDELKKDNEGLKKPLSLNIDETKQEEIKSDQQGALEELNKERGDDGSSTNDVDNLESRNNAIKKQKSAAQKMKEMSEQLQQSSSGSSEATITEDAEMLRQILDNLVTFSFKQEQLYNAMEDSEIAVSQFSNNIKQQQELRGMFEHVDDSLFSLSLRRAELSEFVNEQITEVYYNIDKSLESIADSRIYQGVSYQQYVLNASNSLADFLADILENMQQSMNPGSGSGESKEGFQLPDIIKGQGALQKQMGEMGTSGKDGSKGEKGEQAGDGKKGQGNQGEEGSSGQDGSDGQSGKGGQNGNDGNSNQPGGDNNGGSGNGQTNEEELREIYEIYKKQQLIRSQLENQLKDMINAYDKGLALKLIQQMENFENDLIENGITQRTLNKINVIQHQLLKLENAALKQGIKEKRESNTNVNAFTNPITTKPELLEDYENQIEILNRQALPLQHIFQNKVKLYFKNDN